MIKADTRRLTLAAFMASGASLLSGVAFANACQDVISYGTYTVSLISAGNKANATIDFNAPAMTRRCRPRTVCPMGYHHNVDLVVNGSSPMALDIVSDCTVNQSGYADFALHPQTVITGHLGQIVAEWQFKPTDTLGQYVVTDDFQQTPGSVSSVTANMAGTAKH